MSVSSALCLLPQRAAVLRRFKAATKREILVWCVPAVLFCTCKHKLHIDEVSAATRHPRITASVKLHRFNANGMSKMNNYILPSKVNLMWDKRVWWDFFNYFNFFNGGHLAGLTILQIACWFWLTHSWYLHVTGEEGIQRTWQTSSPINKSSLKQWRSYYYLFF